MLNPRTTLAIILGVSKCPLAPKLQPLPQCRNSAEDFENYLRALGITRENIINLFDSELPAPDQLGEIEDRLARLTTASADELPSDLILYYTGHAGFSRNDQSYFLAIRKTRAESEGGSSIRYVDLASSVKRHTQGLRKYLILDCCFAASAVVRSQADINQVVIQRLEDEMPPSGTAVLCSSAAKLVSIAPARERYTMFSGALLKCLHEGVSAGPKVLTLEDVGKAVRRIIQDKYPNDSVRPELHVPEQTQGNLATVPLFPNLSWSALPTDPGATESSIPSVRPALSRLAKVLRPPLASLILGGICGTLSALGWAILPPPFGITGGAIAPIAPPVLLGTIVFLVALIDRHLTWRAYIFVLTLTFAAWQIAYSIVYFPIMAFLQPTPRAHVFDLADWVFLGSSAAAGYTGATLLTSMLLIFVLWKKVVGSHVLKTATLSSVSLGAWAAISALPAIIGKYRAFELIHMLAVFAPWQSIYLLIVKRALDERTYFFSGRQYFIWFLASVGFTLLLSIRPVQTVINEFVLPPINMQVVSASKEVSSSNANQTTITMAYSVSNNRSRAMPCRLEFRSKKINYYSFYNRDGLENTDSGSTSKSATVSIPKGGLDDVQARLTCMDGDSEYSTQWIRVTLSEYREPPPELVKGLR